MIQFPLEKWHWIGYAVESLVTDCWMIPGPGSVPVPAAVYHQPITDKALKKACEWLDPVKEECDRLGLAVSAETARELIEHLRHAQELIEENEPHASYDWDWFRHQLQSLQKIIRKELQSKAFFYIPPEKVRFWITPKNPFPLGKAVHDAFLSTEMDAAEAGICLAVARPTAAVFHCMRVLEIGLGALGKVFNVSLARTNWGPAIDQIESKIRDMHKDPTWKALPDCKEQQEFYAQAASHFGILKDAWRNYTAHARGMYTEERATLIFENVRAFMQTLATRLRE